MRPLHLLAVFAALGLPSLALAQVAATVHADPSRGATLLPESVAWAHQATSLSYNPAGLNKVGTFELIWAHERSVPRDEVVDGLYFASSPISSLGLGLSIEWLRNAAGTDASRKTSVGLGFGAQTVSLGFAANFFAGPGIDGLTSLDLGIQARPGRYFSAGLTIKNVDNPARGPITLPRTWDLGIGIRPIRERLTVGVDWMFSDTTPLSASRLAYSVKAELWKGLFAHAGFSHGFQPTAGYFFQAGLTVDTHHFGASYAL
ncbi:MAG: signal peptide peptidase SppA, type, partial [Myxococcaceae bacterium]|nr:signal peptide peptidase SppA, type [Myxococcaceae bacterium]